MTQKEEHPVQPLVRHRDGKLRFKRNEIVVFLLQAGPFDLNDLAKMTFAREDYEQLVQLLGYSLGGFGELSFVSDETFHKAAQAANQATGSRTQA